VATLLKANDLFDCGTHIRSSNLLVKPQLVNWYGCIAPLDPVKKCWVQVLRVVVVVRRRLKTVVVERKI
jgi:hypothetical protein